AGPVLSDYFQSRHEARGVAFELSANVAAIEADGVRLADGRLIAANTVLVGIGAYADLELAQAAGLECSDGVVVDLDARTSDPAVFAVGDMTHRPLPLYGRSARLESVPSALEQAKQAASALCGRPRPADEVPWFWSDQYELKLQIAGLAWDCDMVVERGDRAADSFALFHLKDGVVRAVEAVNAAPEFMGGRQLIGRQIAVDPARLADASVPMKALLAGPA
ncbi:ferredoxin reductase, partial [Brevundimonas sp. AAP58]|uniref:oxidoreductase C-terminal domain-containing protein n=1 Tax=Brevundimonas sp. AAP58 TaxID=1523422 RepID=UPI0006CC5085